MTWFREWERGWSVQEVSSVSGTLRRCSGGLLWEWVGCIPGGGCPPPGSGWCPGTWCATIQVDTSDGTVGASLPPRHFPNLWHDLCQLHVLRGQTGPSSHLSLPPIFALRCHLTPYYLLEGFKCRHMLGLQVELELSSLEELVVSQFPDLPNILRYAHDQEPSACPLSYLPAIFSFCMYFILILFITITTFHMLSFFPPNQVYLNVPIFVTSQYWWWT